jgi:hypothetical protein
MDKRALIIVPATAKRPVLVEAPSWRFEVAGRMTDADKR